MTLYILPVWNVWLYSSPSRLYTMPSEIICNIHKDFLIPAPTDRKDILFIILMQMREQLIICFKNKVPGLI